MADEEKNIALEAEKDQKSAVESAYDYLEHYDILETINNVGNDEVFTPRKTCDMILDSLPEEVWHNPNYKWLNPATKNGVFEREIALRLDKGLKDIIQDQETRRKHILQNMIYAIGQTKFTSYVARRTLYYCCDANRKCDGIKAPDGHYVNGYAIGNGEWFEDREGNIKTPKIDHVFGKDGKCVYCRVSKDSKYVDSLQREQYAYDFIHHKPNELLSYLQDLFFKGDRTMKFDIIIGNPPYQLSDGGAQASARPIYQLFIQNAKALNPKYLSMIVPSRWMAGGKGLDEFRDEMLDDRHFRSFDDYPNPKICFPNNDIKGGVCHFVWESDYQGKCHFNLHKNNEIVRSFRFLREEGVDVFIREPILVNILEKVRAYKEASFSEIVSPLKPYGLRGDFFKDTTKYALPSVSETPIEDGITIYGLDEHLKRVKRYVGKDYPLPKRDGISSYKLFMARNQGSGAFGETFSTPVFAEPNEICTETFVVIGNFETAKERDNCYSYIKTKFFRTLVCIKKLDQNASKGVYEYVPLQDFGKEYSDDELYAKYHLSEKEIEFIENNVQEMN